MFPFRFDKLLEKVNSRHEYYKNNSFSSRVAIDSNFKKSLQNNGWRYEKFEVKSSLDYNELVYFYDFVQDALFNIEDFEEGATSYYFEKKLKESAKYIIKVKGLAPYILHLDSIALRVFDTGVAILTFEVLNNDYKDLKDIFNINEYGRHIYPQFVDKEFKATDIRDVFLAEYIEANGVGEFFCGEYKNIKIANFITETLGDTFTANKESIGRYLIQPVIDDRMFVLSHILHNGFSQSVKDKLTARWYEALYVDKYCNKNIQNTEMQSRLIKEHTYARWQEYGTLYGISRYSFILLSSRDSFSNNLLNHIKTIYYQMATLVLANRASILRFSDEVATLSDITPNKELVEKISNLYKNYLRFKNKLYFKEITPQEQGIELYDLMRKSTRIDRDINDLSVEIDSLYNYASMLQDKTEQEEMALLTKLGAIFLPPTLLAGMFGMNYIDFVQHSPIWSLVATLLIITSAFMGYIMIEKTKYKVTKIVIMAIMITIFGVFVYSYPINNSNDTNTTTMTSKLIKKLKENK